MVKRTRGLDPLSSGPMDEEPYDSGATMSPAGQMQAK
jgi:hypothetical protein